MSHSHLTLPSEGRGLGERETDMGEERRPVKPVGGHGPCHSTRHEHCGPLVQSIPPVGTTLSLQASLSTRWQLL